MFKLLIIDDDSKDAHTLRWLLESKLRVPVESAIAMTMADGVNKCQQFKPDLVILDLLLPDVADGEETVRRIPEMGDACVVVFSGVASEELEFQSIRIHGAQDFIVKGTGLNIIDRVVKACWRAEYRREKLCQ